MSSNRADDAPRKEVKMYDPTVAVIIGYDTDDGPSHPLFDGASNMTPLNEADIMFTYDHGILQPISCRRDGDRLLVVFGRGRTRLLREANIRRIRDGLAPWFLPVQIVKGDETKMRILKIGENNHRRVIDPMQRARDAYELSQQMPEEKAATSMGLGVPQFRNILKLLDVAPAVADAVTRGELSATAATELSTLSESDQVAQLAALTSTVVEGDGADAVNGSNGKKPSTRDVRARVREAQGKTAIETPAQKIKHALDALDKLDDSATKDELWAAIRKVRRVLTPTKN